MARDFAPEKRVVRAQKARQGCGTGSPTVQPSCNQTGGAALRTYGASGFAGP